MRRRKKYLDQRQSDNHDRWLVSYADFITLLFAFFVVMYAISSVSEGKYRMLSDSLVSAFRNSPADAARSGPPPAAQILPREAQPRRGARPTDVQRRHRERMRGIAKDILKALGTLAQEGQVKVTQSNRGVAIEINASVLFAAGQASLQTDSQVALRQVARVLSGTDYGIQVEGYSDNTPISTAQFPSNWELSATRASSVVRLFVDNGVAEERLTAVGYGPNRAVVSNATPEGRARNRRVTVMILAPAPDQATDVPLGEAPPAL